MAFGSPRLRKPEIRSAAPHARWRNGREFAATCRQIVGNSGLPQPRRSRRPAGAGVPPARGTGTGIYDPFTLRPAWSANPAPLRRDR